MSDALDIDALLERFRERAEAVKRRNLPPVGGDERAAFVKQAQTDYMDYAMIGDAEEARRWHLDPSNRPSVVRWMTAVGFRARRCGISLRAGTIASRCGRSSVGRAQPCQG